VSPIRRRRSGYAPDQRRRPKLNLFLRGWAGYFLWELGSCPRSDQELCLPAARVVSLLGLAAAAVLAGSRGFTAIGE
jgi:hypothetical protein